MTTFKYPDYVHSTKILQGAVLPEFEVEEHELNVIDRKYF